MNHTGTALVITCLAISLSGCGAFANLVRSGQRAGGPGQQTSTRGLTVAQRTTGVLREAQTLGVPKSPDAFEDAHRAWTRAITLATTVEKRYCGGDTSEPCNDQKVVLAKVAASRKQFLERAFAEANEHFVRWTGTLLVSELQKGWHGGELPVRSWLKQVVGTYAAQAKRQLEAGMRDHVQETGKGVCTFHTAKTRGKRQDARSVDSMFAPKGTIYVRCTAPQAFARYGRSKPDFVSIQPWNPKAGRFEPTGQPIQLRRTPRGDTVEVKVPARALLGHVRGKGGAKAGDLAHFRIRYIAARITHQQQVWRHGRYVIENVWDLQTAAEGKFFLKTR